MLLPVAVNAAQCKVDGKWYPYNHPKCSSPASSGHSNRSLDPIQAVKESPYVKGGTIEERLKQKTSAPAVSDLGWSKKTAQDGFVVEKTIHVRGLRSPTIYRWSVSLTGAVRPINGHAISLSGR